MALVQAKRGDRFLLLKQKSAGPFLTSEQRRRDRRALDS